MESSLRDWICLFCFRGQNFEVVRLGVRLQVNSAFEDCGSGAVFGSNFKIGIQGLSLDFA